MKVAAEPPLFPSHDTQETHVKIKELVFRPPALGTRKGFSGSYASCRGRTPRRRGTLT